MIVEKRLWHYLLPPAVFEITCEKCDGTNLCWSEFKSHIWCYDCEIDFDPKHGEHSGIFSGPILIHVSYMMGMSFDRFNMETQQIELFNIDNCNWDTLEEAAKLLLQEKNPYGQDLWDRARQYFKSEMYGMSEEVRKILLETTGEKT